MPTARAETVDNSCKLFVGLFGKCRFTAGGRPWPFAAPPRTLPLLAYLIIHRHSPVSRESVAFTLWPDDAESQARANLRRHIHYLQNALPASRPGAPWILTTGRTTIQWNAAAPARVDVIEFERLGAEDKTRAEAVQLYTGPLLDETQDEWIVFERERLRNLQIGYLAQLSAASRRDGDFSEALRFARLVNAIDPWREDTIRQIMELRYAMGDRAGALAEFEDFTRRLSEALDVEPMGETQSCYESIVRSAPIVQADPGSPSFAAPAYGHRRALPFVGREPELQTLRRWWTQAARGSGNLALVAGEGGVGKTRLLHELRRLVDAEGGRVLSGNAAFNETVAYQPIMEALRGALPLLAALRIDRAWLSPLLPLLPELAARVQGLAPPAEAAAVQERARLFEAVVRILTALSAERPLLLILEDLHWTGPATFDLLEHLARHVPAVRMLVVASYREEEVDRVHPVRALLRQLEPSGAVHRLALGPIDERSVAALVAKLERNVPCVRDGARVLYARSEGNPLYLEQLIAAAVDADVPVAHSALLPGTLRELIADRFARLSQSTRGLAQTAAVVGDVFDIEVLFEVTAWSENDVRSAVEELLDRRFIRDAGSELHANYAFAHNLIEKTIYAQAEPGALAQRHYRVATVMEDLYAARLDEYANRIASHFHRSSSPGRAAPFYARSARRSLAGYAYGEAAASAAQGIELADADDIRFELLLLRERAHAGLGDGVGRRADLEALEGFPPRAISLPMRIELMVRRIEFYNDAGQREAEATAIGALRELISATTSPEVWIKALRLEARYHDGSARFEESRALLQSALELATGQNGNPARIEIHCDLAKLAERQGDYGRASAHIAQARDLTRDRPETALRVRVLIETARLLNNKKATLELEGVARELLTCAQSCGDAYGSAFAHNALGIVAERRRDTQTARRHYASAFDYFEGLGHRLGAIAVLNNQASSELALGRWREALSLAERARALARESSTDDFYELATLHATDAMLRGGKNLRALGFAREALESARRSGSQYKPFAISKLGEVFAAAGDTDAALASFREAAELIEGAGLEVLLASTLAFLALAYVQANRLPDALSAIERADALLLAHSEDVEEPQRAFWISAQVHHAAGELAVAEARLQRAHDIFTAALGQLKDAEMRRAFEELEFHREIVAAHDRDGWPPIGGRPPLGSRRSVR